MAEAVEIRITASDGASQTFRAIGGSARQMGSDIEQSADAATRSLADIADVAGDVGTVLTGVGAAGVAGFGLASRGSMQLQSAMANVQSIAQGSEAELASLTEQVRSLAVELAASPTDLAAGLYDITSSGFEAAEAMQILESSAIAARAGLTSTATSAQAITAVLNAYGMEASAAGDVSDVLFKTVDSGVITFDELANSMGRTLPLASTLAVSIEELGAAYAELTLQGISAREAETAIAGIMRAALNPTEALTEAVEAYGYASAEALIQAEGLAGFLTFLRRETGGSAAAMREFVVDSEALTGALALTSGSVDEFTARVSEMEAAAQDGAYTMQVFETQTDTAAFAVQRAIGSLRDIGTTFGNALLPYIDSTADAIAGLAQNFASLPTPMQENIALAGAFTSAATLAAGAVLLLTPRIVALHGALTTLAGAGLANAVVGLGAFTAAAGVAVGAGYAIGRAGRAVWDSFQEGEPVILRVSAALQSLSDGDVLGFFRQLAFGVDEANAAVGRIENTFEGLWSEVARQELLGNEAISQSLRDLLVDVETVDGVRRARYNDEQRMAAETARLVGLYGISVEDAERRVAESMSWTNEEFALREELVNTIAGAMLQGGEEADALASRVDFLTQQFNDNRITADEWLLGLRDIAREFELIPGAADETATAVDGLASSFDVVGNAAGGALAPVAEELGQAAQEAEALRVKLLQAGVALAGFDDALSRAVLAQMGGDAAVLAENMTVAGNAAENTFRVIVSNTDAIKSQADQTLQWADNLIAVRGEFSRLDELVQQGLITGQSGVFDDGSQYAAAQNAYDSIAETTEQIALNLDAVQAIQAPLIAEAQEGVAQWTEELRGMSAEQQRIALGWFDATTASQAMEAQMLITAAAAGEMGAAGEQATQQFIEGAVAANPILEDLLTDLGLVARDHEGNLVINFDDGGARSDMELLNESVRELTDLLDDGEINGSVGIQVENEEEVRELENTLVEIDGRRVEASVGVSVDLAGGGGAAGGALAGIFSGAGDGAIANALSIPESVSVDVTATTTGTEDVQELAGTIETVDGTTAMASVSVEGADGAIVWLNAVEAAANDIPTATFTSVNIAGAVSGAALLDGVTAAAQGIPVGTFTAVSVSGAASAVSALNSVANAAANVPTSVTTYIDTVRRTFYQDMGRPGGVMTGGAIWGGAMDTGRFGFAQAATGRTVMVGEAGPELVTLPHGAQVMPHGASMSRLEATGGRGGISIDFSGATFHNTSRAEMNAWAGEDLVPAIVKAIDDRERAYGGHR